MRMILEERYVVNAMINEYKRTDALKYASAWALKRNPRYYDFSEIGGDCTNFCSQVLHSGGCRMNYSQNNRWYYSNGYNKSPSWTGVNFFYSFLTGNHEAGPVAREVSVKNIMLGDIIQLSFVNENLFNHSLVVVQHGIPADISNIKIATHTYDRYNYMLTNYDWTKIRFLHIIGYK